jgi:hypothetical protein
LANVILPEPKKIKLRSRTCDCVFIGYACSISCYRFLVIKSDVLDCNIIIESKNAIFSKHVCLLKNKEKILHIPSIVSNEIVDDVQELRRSKQARKEKNFDNDFIAYVIDDDPTCYDEAIKSIDESFLLETINNKLD